MKTQNIKYVFNFSKNLIKLKIIDFLFARNSKIFLKFLLIGFLLSSSTLLSENAPQRKDPNKDDNLHYNMGVLAAEKDDYDGALKEFGTAISINPKNMFALYARAGLYYEKNNFGDALKDLDALIKINDKDEKALNLRAVINQQTENYRAAIPDYEKLIKISPKNNNYLLNLGFCYQSNNDKEKAIKSYLAAEKNGATNDELIYNLASLYYDTKKTDKAEQYIQKAISKNIANDYLLTMYIDILFEKNDCDVAENILNKFDKILTDKSSILMNIGICYMNNANFSKAMTFFEKSYKQSPKLVENLFYLANAQVRNKQNELAMGNFQKFIDNSVGRHDLEKYQIQAKEQIEYLKNPNKPPKEGLLKNDTIFIHPIDKK